MTPAARGKKDERRMARSDSEFAPGYERERRDTDRLLGGLHVRTQAERVERQLRAEVELERNRLRDVLAQAPAPMALLDGPDHRFAFVNAAYVTAVGRDHDQLLGKPIRTALPELVNQGFVELLDHIYQSGEPYFSSTREVNLRRHEREQKFYYDFSYFPIRTLSGAVNGILFHGVDVSEAVRAKALLQTRVTERTFELEEAQQRLRIVNTNLTQAQDEERRRLALELHDGAGQLVVALKWNLERLELADEPEVPEISILVKDSLRLLDELSQELRSVSHLLLPPLLEEAGFPSALRIYVEGLRERSGLAVQLDIDAKSQRLPQELGTAIFRIIQEALTNVHRHASTKSAHVRISHDSRAVEVRIQDKGTGMHGFTSLEDPAVKLGVGIHGMRERVRQLNGQFGIESGAGGTTLTAVFPLDDSSDIESSELCATRQKTTPESEP